MIGSTYTPIPNRDFKRLIDLRPQFKSIRRGQSAALSWSFKVRIENGDVVMAAGFRAVIDSPWEAVAEQSLGTAAADQVAWMAYRYSTEQNPGEWSVGLGSPPAMDSTRYVARIARIVSESGALRVEHEHLGNISVLDIGDCE